MGRNSREGWLVVWEDFNQVFIFRSFKCLIFKSCDLKAL